MDISPIGSSFEEFQNEIEKRSDPAMMVGNIGYERRDADFYPTPTWLSEAVIPHLRQLGCGSSPAVWEPACGNGAMSAVLKQHFQDVRCSDLNDRGYGEAGIDFLAQDDEFDGLIITNPPFAGMAEAFVRHALKLTQARCGAVAMLLRHEYDTAKSRADLFSEPPFCRRVTVTTRPRWIAGTTGSPRHSYAWFLWDWNHRGPATLHYHVER